MRVENWKTNSENYALGNKTTTKVTGIKMINSKTNVLSYFDCSDNMNCLPIYPKLRIKKMRNRYLISS
jgi:hypothetical protein